MEKVMPNGFAELSVDDMFDTDGGVWWEVCAAAWVCYEVGYAIGKAIAHATSK
ncbi:MAG: hypothetical protein K2J08_07915 [Ruminococcus sp.]|nr:hypothetical protein [Ruminococcus sp.]